MRPQNGSVRWGPGHGLLLSLLTLALLLEVQGCREECDASSTVTAPSIKSIMPSSAVAGGPGFTLQVIGNAQNQSLPSFGFNAVVRWNGSDRPTRLIDADNLEAIIPSSDITSPGTARVTVFNPGDEFRDTLGCVFRFLRAESAPVTFSITPGPVPAVSPLAAAITSSFLPPPSTLASLGFARRPLLVLDDRGNVYLIAEQPLPPHTAILFSRSADRGRTFSAPADLASSPAVWAAPDAAFEGATKLFVLWRHESDAGLDSGPGATAAESVALLLLSLQMIDRQQGLDWRHDGKAQLVLNALSALAASAPGQTRRDLDSFAKELAAPQSAPPKDQQAGYLRSLADFGASLTSASAP